MTLTESERNFFLSKLKRSPYVYIYEIKSDIRKKILDKFKNNILVEIRKDFLFKINKEEFIKQLNFIPNLEINEFIKSK